MVPVENNAGVSPVDIARDKSHEECLELVRKLEEGDRDGEAISF